MKWCESCGVKVKGSHEYCPLCDAKLICTKEETMDEFPREYPINKQKSRMLKLASILLCINGIICVLINTIYPTSINWSMIVVVVLVSVRIGLGIAVAKHGRVLKTSFSAEHTDCWNVYRNKLYFCRRYKLGSLIYIA